MSLQGRDSHTKASETEREMGLSETASKVSRQGLQVPRLRDHKGRYFQNRLWQGKGTSARRSCLRKIQMLKPLGAVISILEGTKEGFSVGHNMLTA